MFWRKKADLEPQIQEQDKPVKLAKTPAWRQMLIKFGGLKPVGQQQRIEVFRAPELFPGVVPKGVTPAIANDDSISTYQFANQAWSGDNVYTPFPGYSYLAMLMTRAEYRLFGQVISTELSRKWIKVIRTAKDDINNDRIPVIEARLKAMNIKRELQLAAAQECFFGRGQLVITIDDHILKDPLIISPKTVKKGSLRRINSVEAMWTTPSAYNALDPSAPDFYRPTQWFMLGKEIHASRLLTVVTRPLPDMLKPAYNFSGMSLSQLAQPYVDNWLRIRQSVSDIINTYSITALQTDMSEALVQDGSGDDLLTRAQLFTTTRSNLGLMLLDKDREDLVQLNTPLSGLAELQAAAQEHMCSISQIPLVKFTGISPSGLNASGESELRVFGDTIKATQETFWSPVLKIIIDLIQLDEFGEIDPNITHEWEPLEEMNETQRADIRNKEAQTDAIYVNLGAIASDEVRERLAIDQSSGYMGLDLAREIEAPGGNGLDDAINDADESKKVAGDSEKFEESKHTRKDNGEFGSGNGIKDLKSKANKNKLKMSTSRNSKPESIKAVFEKSSPEDLKNISDSLTKYFKKDFDVNVTGVKYSQSEHAVEIEASDEEADHYLKYTFTKEDGKKTKLELTTTTAPQGSGAAKKVMTGLLKTAHLTGVESIDTHANMDVGGYVWAKCGFVPYKNSWDDLRKHLSSKEGLSNEAKDILSNENPKSIFALADSEEGKKLLLNTSWYGHLDMHDDDARSRAVSYANT
jgi:phage-related protein (TIGR01555 family)